MTTDQPRARIGTSGWKKPQWRSHFYPPLLAQRRELEYAAARLTSLEINTTFYALAKPSNFLGWHAETPADFVFSVKGNRAVTHDDRLADPVRGVAEFFASGVLGLQEKLGPVLWQLPPSLTFDQGTIEALLATLPHSFGEVRPLAAGEGDRPIRHALEVRNGSFLDPAFLELLGRYDVAAVQTGYPDGIQHPTSDFVYVRLHGAQHPDGYDDETLDRWADLVRGWLTGSLNADKGAREVFVYFHDRDDAAVRPPFDAMRLQALVDGPNAVAAAHGDTSVQLPLWEE